LTKLLGDFNAKVRRENIFKPKIEKDSNINGVGLVNFATSKNLVVKSTIFPRRNIFINISGPLLMVKITTRLTTY